MTLLFLHGWGFDSSLWDRLRAELAPLSTEAWDRGYFGRPAAPAVTGPVVAIGHSLGSLLFAAAPPPGCVATIAINGFDRFVGDGRVPARLLDRMRRRFAVAPAEVLDDFRMRADGTPHRHPIDAARLAADLDALATIDARGRTRPLLVLHGDDDPILPPAMREQAFAGAPRATLAQGGHLLPATHAGWCADRIRDALSRL